MSYRFVVQDDNDDRLGVGQESGGVGSLFEISVHVVHSAREVGLEPFGERVDVPGTYRRGIGYADEVKAELKSFLLDVSVKLIKTIILNSTADYTHCAESRMVDGGCGVGYCVS